MHPETDGRVTPERTNPTIAIRLGRTVLGILGAYIGIKIGEDIIGSTLPFAIEIGAATAAGSAAVNVSFSKPGQQNNSSEQ